MNITRARSGSASMLFKLRALLRSAPRWATLIIAILFAIFYVGFWMSSKATNHVQEVYPDLLPKLGFYIHAIPGSIWLILGALQFFSYIRVTSPAIHRLLGMICLFSMLGSVIGGFMIIGFGKVMGGKSLSYFGTLFFAWWLLCCSLGWYNMRYLRNIENHRAWMLRAYVISYAIILMRPATVLYCVLDPSKTVGQSLAVVAPLLWVTSLISSEAYLRRSSPNQGDLLTQSVRWMYTKK